MQETNHNILYIINVIMSKAISEEKYIGKTI